MPYFFADENEDSGYESDGGTKYRPYAELNKGTYSRVRQFRSINRRRQQKVVTVLSPISDNAGKMKYGEKSLADARAKCLFFRTMYPDKRTVLIETKDSYRLIEPSLPGVRYSD